MLSPESVDSVAQAEEMCPKGCLAGTRQRPLMLDDPCYHRPHQKRRQHKKQDLSAGHNILTTTVGESWVNLAIQRREGLPWPRLLTHAIN